MMMLQLWWMQAQMMLRDFVKKEDGDVNIVSIVVLIGIAVLLAIVFKNRISSLLGTMFDTIETNALDVIGN